MSNIVIPATDAEFRKLLDTAGARTVLVDFFAEWCGPCKIMAPALEAYAQANPDVLVVKADVDALQEIAAAYGIRGIPTLELIREGQTLGKKVGAVTAPQLSAFVSEKLAA